MNENILTVDITVRRLNDGVLEFLFTDTCYRMTFCSRKWSLMKKKPVKSTLNRLAKVQEAGGLLLLDDPPQKYLPLCFYLFISRSKNLMITVEGAMITTAMAVEYNLFRPIVMMMMGTR